MNHSRAKHLLVLSLTVMMLLSRCNVGYGQGSVDQEAVRALIEDQKGSVEAIKKVNWQVFILPRARNTDSIVRMLARFVIDRPGAYDSIKRMQIIELANRVRLPLINTRTSVVVPVAFYNDYRSYTPYPLYYSAAAFLPRLFIIDKCTQTFGAYEYGSLVHWGLVSSGRSNGSTPEGRYNFNWKTYYKLSNAAPAGVEWHLYWVYDFYAKIGLHVHQYPLPINAPASHGCVRTARPDAEWNYTWASGWQKDKAGRLLRNGTPVMVINNNPPHNKAFHWQIMAGDSVVSLVTLPQKLTDIRLGSAEQQRANWESGW